MVGRPSSVCTSWTVTIPGHTLPRRREAVSWMKSSHSQEEPPTLRWADHSSETGAPATSVIAYAAKSNLLRLSEISGLSVRTSALAVIGVWPYSALLKSPIGVPESPKPAKGRFGRKRSTGIESCTPGVPCGCRDRESRPHDLDEKSGNLLNTLRSLVAGRVDEGRDGISRHRRAPRTP